MIDKLEKLAESILSAGVCCSSCPLVGRRIYHWRHQFQV